MTHEKCRPGNGRGREFLPSIFCAVPPNTFYFRYSHNLERVPKFSDLISSLLGPAEGQSVASSVGLAAAQGGPCIFHPGPRQERCFREEKPAENALFAFS